MTFATLKRVMRLVEPYIDGDYCLGAGNDELYIQVGALPENVALILEELDVSIESGALTSGGTLTIFL